MRDEARQEAALEERCRQVFGASVDAVDMRVRSRLTRARHAALEAAVSDPGFWRRLAVPFRPTAGLTAAVLLAGALWLAVPHHVGAPETRPSFDDLDLVATTEDGSSDALEMLQNDLDFYDFAEKAASSEPTA